MVNLFVMHCAKLGAQMAAKMSVQLVLMQANQTVMAWERLVHERQRTAHMLRMEPLFKALVDQRVAEARVELEADHQVRLMLVQLYGVAQDGAECDALELLCSRLDAARSATLMRLELELKQLACF